MKTKLNRYEFEDTLAYEAALEERHSQISSRGYTVRAEANVGADALAVKIYRRDRGMYRMRGHNFYRAMGWAVVVNGAVVFADTIKALKQKIAN